MIDANVVLEVLYKRDRWVEAYRLLNAVKRGDVGAYMLHFAIHGICAVLGRPPREPTETGQLDVPSQHPRTSRGRLVSAHHVEIKTGILFSQF